MSNVVEVFYERLCDLFPSENYELILSTDKAKILLDEQVLIRINLSGRLPIYIGEKGRKIRGSLLSQEKIPRIIFRDDVISFSPKEIVTHPFIFEECVRTQNLFRDDVISFSPKEIVTHPFIFEECVRTQNLVTEKIQNKVVRFSSNREKIQNKVVRFSSNREKIQNKVVKTLNHFCSLDDDSMRMVFSFLMKDLQKLSVICRRFHKILIDDTFWNTFILGYATATDKLLWRRCFLGGRLLRSFQGVLTKTRVKERVIAISQTSPHNFYYVTVNGDIHSYNINPARQTDFTQVVSGLIPYNRIVKKIFFQEGYILILFLDSEFIIYDVFPSELQMKIEDVVNISLRRDFLYITHKTSISCYSIWDSIIFQYSLEFDCKDLVVNEKDCYITVEEKVYSVEIPNNIDYISRTFFEKITLSNRIFPNSQIKSTCKDEEYFFIIL